MENYKISYEVLCLVKVWHNVKANNLDECLHIAYSSNDAPTSMQGVDYEIISDNEVLSINIEKDLE